MKRKISLLNWVIAALGLLIVFIEHYEHIDSDWLYLCAGIGCIYGFIHAGVIGPLIGLFAHHHVGRIKPVIQHIHTVCVVKRGY